jgi:hypothetical protein
MIGDQYRARVQLRSLMLAWLHRPRLSAAPETGGLCRDVENAYGSSGENGRVPYAESVEVLFSLIAA